MHTQNNIQYLGMAQPGRNWNDASGDYRYGYNGKEEANSLDFGARWYDPRKARWDAVDAFEAVYVGVSPYVFAGNNPILNKEIDGNFYFTYHIALEMKAIERAYSHLSPEKLLEKKHP